MEPLGILIIPSQARHSYAVVSQSWLLTFEVMH